jgi:hypothetical protein
MTYDSNTTLFTSAASTVKRWAIDVNFRSRSSFASSAIRMCSGDMLLDLGVSSCFPHPIRSFVRPFPPMGPVAATSSVALRFPIFIGVGSEVARLRAGHRPPLKLHVRFSRMQLSRRVGIP